MKVRVACAHILVAVIRQEASLNTLLPTYIAQIPEQDHGLLQELCSGTLRHLPALQVIVEYQLSKPLKKKDDDILALLLSGLYQIREMRTPPHAAVNESVATSVALKKNWAKGLINSVLRKYLRERDAIDRLCEKDDRFHSMHPQWLEQMLIAHWGDRAPSIMAGNNGRPPMVLRVNQQQVSRHDYLAILAERQLVAEAAPYSEQGIYLQTPCNVEDLPSFAEGAVSVQDEAAQLCANVLDLTDGQRVLDSCCAPGGKTCHMLEHQPGLAEVVALDEDPKRLVRVEQNLLRLQLSATLKAADARQVNDWWDGKPFDRILLDAPCSATGVIRRHPDIKVLRRPEDIAKLAATQLELLEALWSTLKTGGKLLYATCSILVEENDRVIEKFVDTHSEAVALKIDAPWGIATTFGRQLFPTAAGHDGFYYALLTKQAREAGNVDK